MSQTALSDFWHQSALDLSGTLLPRSKMSEVPSILDNMKRVSEDQLADWLNDRGYLIIETDDVIGSQWGWTSTRDKVVALKRGMKQYQRVPALMHEVVHVEYGHEGHQSQAVEDRINALVASRLIDPVDYQFCETQLGWSSGGIAAELGVPKWVVQAYRHSLSKTPREGGRLRTEQ